MRVLLITQEIDENSALLGVTLTWIRHLAPKVDHVSVLALSVGAARLPENVSLYSMGKERSANKLSLLKNFQSHLWRLLRRREVDVIFVHMVPRYAILAAPLARLYGVPLVLWNAHGTVSRYLRLAHRLVAAVVTASPESFRINSPKRIVTGHGIDTDYFTADIDACERIGEERRLQTCATDTAAEQEPTVFADGRRLQTCATGAAAEQEPTVFADGRRLQTCATGPSDAATGGDIAPVSVGSKVLLTVGRLSRSKDYGAIIRALALLRSQSPTLDARLRIIGTPFFADDHAYLAELEKLVGELGLNARVTFVGKVPNRLMVEEYRRCDVLINSSHTGSIDKVVLEAMACEKPALTCNESFAPLLADHADLLLFAPSNPEELAQRLSQVLTLEPDYRSELGRALRRLVVDDHSVAGLTDRFVEVFARVTATPAGPVSSAK